MRAPNLLEMKDINQLKKRANEKTAALRRVQQLLPRPSASRPYEMLSRKQSHIIIRCDLTPCTGLIAFLSLEEKAEEPVKRRLIWLSH